MGTDDDLDDDAGLKSLRAVWLSMPDEDPPERGLAELMAAARVKAEAMAEASQPSLWQRFLDMMRRPQVLALATIMILIGGAVFISRRHEELQVSAPTPRSSTPTTGSAQGQNMALDTGAVDIKEEAAPAAAPASATAPELAKGKDEGEAHAVETPKRDPKIVTKKPAPKTSERRTRFDSESDGMFDKGGAASAPSVESKIGAGGGAGGDVAATTTTEATAAPPPAEEPTVQQLHDQARRAASKQQCATVKELAKRIAARDPAFYRANIATDKSLAGCLK